MMEEKAARRLGLAKVQNDLIELLQNKGRRHIFTPQETRAIKLAIQLLDDYKKYAEGKE